MKKEKFDEKLNVASELILESTALKDFKPLKAKKSLLEIFEKGAEFEEDILTHDLKFLAFIKQITEKNYFKGCEEGSKEYQERFNRAREKYLTSLESKINQAEDFKNKGNDFVAEKKNIVRQLNVITVL